MYEQGRLENRVTKSFRWLYYKNSEFRWDFKWSPHRVLKNKSSFSLKLKWMKTGGFLLKFFMRSWDLLALSTGSEFSPYESLALDPSLRRPSYVPDGVRFEISGNLKSLVIVSTSSPFLYSTNYALHTNSWPIVVIPWTQSRKLSPETLHSTRIWV